MKEQPDQRILDYLRQHPRAADSLEGIAGWWLLRQQVCEALSAVRQGLERLTAEGIVTERRGADGRVLYSLCGADGARMASGD
jgi:DNA-binding transcriptional regulator PaaX